MTESIKISTIGSVIIILVSQVFLNATQMGMPQNIIHFKIYDFYLYVGQYGLNALKKN
jgi:hypothetical protein